MAHITHKLEILADLSQPAAEIANIISAFLRYHPGKEAEILRTIGADIDDAITQFTEKVAV